ncbi:MAG: hypothetical protein GY757_33275 [bacterium]|nr:hypothetical protein [bacterium]
MQNEIRISLLTTALYYWLEYVFIAELNGKYRLIVYNKGKILVDDCYKDAKGAKIAFQKIYNYRLTETISKILQEKGKTKAKWTPFYPPHKKWLRQFKGLDFESSTAWTRSPNKE